MSLLNRIDFPDEPTPFAIETQDEYVVADHENGDTFRNDGRTALYVENSTGSAVTITVAAPRPCNHGFQHPVDIVVPNGFAGFVAMEFENDRFSDPSTGLVSLSYSDAGLNVAAVRLPR